MLAMSSALMMKPVVISPVYLRGRLEDDQRNVCNGGIGRVDKRSRGERQRVDERNRVQGGPGRAQEGRKGLQVVRLDRPAPYSRDQVMAWGIDRVPELSEEEYEEACRLCRKRVAIRLQEMTGDSHLRAVEREKEKRQKAKEFEDVCGRFNDGPSPLQLQIFAGTVCNSRLMGGGSSS